MNWTVLLPNFRHSGCLLEVAEAVMYGLRHAGETAEMSSGPRHGTRHVVFDAHRGAPVPEGAIIYQTEVPSSGWWTPEYVELLSKHEVWEYSPANLPAYERHGLPTPNVVAPGWVPELERIQPAAEQDIDVLFYGSPNERRMKVLAELMGRGLRVVHLMGVYGAERDAFVARSKVVLSMHFYEGAPEDAVRTFYLQINRVPVVAEGRFRYEKLARSCEVLARGDLRGTIADVDWDRIRARPMRFAIEAALARKPEGQWNAVDLSAIEAAE